MSEPFLAEIRMMGFGFAPRGWAMCDGQTLPINQNQSLYSLLGTTYGGDGRTNFNLPDLRGRVPIHTGNDGTGGVTWQEGQLGGEETHTLSVPEMPAHTHTLEGSSQDGNSINTNGTVLAREVGNPYSASNANLVDLRTGTISNAGGGQAHENMQPFLAVNYCIAIRGLFPSRN
ncbi:MAG: tail fiber protein [Pseudomonadota bacterium]